MTTNPESHEMNPITIAMNMNTIAADFYRETSGIEVGTAGWDAAATKAVFGFLELVDGQVSAEPTTEQGRPYRWLLETGKRAPTCPQHGERTDGLGVCPECVSEFRESLGSDPYEWTECFVCALPLHPIVEAGGHDTCPSCVEG